MLGQGDVVNKIIMVFSLLSNLNLDNNIEFDYAINVLFSNFIQILSTFHIIK